MSPEVLRQNNNYPFKTSAAYTWYICLDDEGEVCGFMPVKASGKGPYIDNYYIGGDSADVLDCLLLKLISCETGTLGALAHKRHVDDFRRHGFESRTVFAQYDKMQRPCGKGDGGL